MKASLVFDRYFAQMAHNPAACAFVVEGRAQAEVVVMDRRGVCLPRRRAIDEAPVPEASAMSFELDHV